MFRVRIRELRKRAGYRSQRAFADAFGVAQTTVAGWESGKREPNYATVNRLATFFGVSIGYLLGQSKSESIVDLGDDNRATITYSHGPIALLCSQYDIDSAMFAKISRMDPSLAELLTDPPARCNTASTAATAELYQQLTPEQVKNIVAFFRLDPSLTKLTIHTPIPLLPDHSVREKVDRLYLPLLKFYLAYQAASDDDKAVVNAALRKYLPANVSLEGDPVHSHATAYTHIIE